MNPRGAVRGATPWWMQDAKMMDERNLDQL